MKLHPSRHRSMAKQTGSPADITRVSRVLRPWFAVLILCALLSYSSLYRKIVCPPESQRASIENTFKKIAPAEPSQANDEPRQYSGFGGITESLFPLFVLASSWIVMVVAEVVARLRLAGWIGLVRPPPLGDLGSTLLMFCGHQEKKCEL